MIMNRFLFSTLLLFLFCACDYSSKESTTIKNRHKTKHSEFNYPEYFNAFQDSLSNRKDLIEVASLSYTDNEGNTQQVKGFVDKTFAIVKLMHEQSFINGKIVKTSFYYNGIEKNFSQQEISILKENKSYFSEKISCYNSKNKVIYTGARFSNDAIKLSSNKFKKVDFIIHDDIKAKEIINQKGDFQTNFQGFMEMLDRAYLLVGTEKYGSTLAFQEYSGILKLLKNRENLYKNKPLKIEFEILTEANGFTFQALTGIELVNNKQ